MDATMSRATPDNIPSGVLLAGIPRRIAARVLDLLFIITALAALFIGVMVTDGSASAFWSAFGLTSIAAGVGVPAVEVFCVGRYGATPGKRLLGLRVIPSGDGGRPGAWRSLLRAIVVVAPLLVLPPLAIVPIAWALIDPNHQGLHDKLAGTLVVRTS